MSEVLDPAGKVYEGVWRIWSRDSVTGLTWTLNQNSANLLSNVLTLFIALVAGQVWTIIRFALHYSRKGAAEDPSNIRLQQRVLLRNASSDLHTIRLLIRLAWKTRRSIQNTFSYPLTIAALAVLHYALFILAQTFLNSLVGAGSLVLAVSPNCGDWTPEYFETLGDGGNLNISSMDTMDLSLQFYVKRDHNVQLSLEYAQECYPANPRFTTTSPSCETIKSPHLDFSFETVYGPCPFGTGMCQEPQQSITFTTQTIDSHHDLGINAPEVDRLLYRGKRTCAVLNSTYVEEVDAGLPNATAFAYYGPSTLEGANFTYTTANTSSLYTEFAPQETTPYRLNTQFVYAPSPRPRDWGCFTPIAPLAATANSSDLVLFFLSYTGRYFTPIDDPWFAAHNLHIENTTSPLAREQYSRDSMVSTLACAEQHQFCSGASGECTPFLGWGQVQDLPNFNSKLTRLQTLTFQRMLWAVAAGSFSQFTQTLSMTSTPLIAVEKCASRSTTLSLHLPDNQWQLELQYWQTIAMSQIQRTMVQWATGQIAPNPVTQMRPPETAEEKWFCDNLLVPSRVYQSFSVLGVVLTVVLGCLIIVIACTVERIAAYLQRVCGRDTRRTSRDDQNVLNIFGQDEKIEKGLTPPMKDFNPVKDLERGRLQTAQINTPQRPDLPPGYRSFDSRCSTLRSEMEIHYHHAPPQTNKFPVSNNTPSSWMDQPLSDEKALPATPITPRQVFETWRHERRSKRHGYQV